MWSGKIVLDVTACIISCRKLLAQQDIGTVLHMGSYEVNDSRSPRILMLAGIRTTRETCIKGEVTNHRGRSQMQSDVWMMRVDREAS